MNEVFNYVPSIGMLYIHEIYLFYDEPQLFSCINKSSQKFLVTLTDMDVNNKSWLITPASEPRLLQMKKNKITLKEMFVKPETEIIWRVIEKNKTVSSSTVNPAEIPDIDLPDENEYLDLPDENISDELQKSGSDIIEAAKSEFRDILDISLEENNSHEHEIDCDILSKVLIDTQQIAYSIAENQDKDSQKSRKERKNFLQQHKLRASISFPASFGIRLKSNEMCNAFLETPVTPVLKSFADLLEATKDREKFKMCLNAHSKKTIIRYRFLMKTLLSANTGINIKGASPSDFVFEAGFNTHELAGYLDILNKEIENIHEEKEYIGSPVAMNIDKRFFSFKKVDNEYISGTVSEAFDVRSFLTHTTAKIRVIEDIDINTITDEERRKYHLISLEAING